MPDPVRRAPVALLLLILLSSPAFAEERVTFRTADGLDIVGTLYASGRHGAAGVVALPMYGHDRSTYAPLAERFTRAGIDLLAIDLRGHGESAIQDGIDLSERVKTRDAALFNAMWQDALAGRDFLVARGTDPRRVALLGASVGCSVAIDAASRSERVVGVCVLTPGKAYLGVDTMEDLPGYGERPMLILSSKEEAAHGATPIQEALGASAELVLFDETGIHGTRMFVKVPGVEERIVKWFDELLGGDVALDGKVDEREKAQTPAWTWDGKDGVPGPHVQVRLHQRWLHLVARPTAGNAPPLTVGLEWSNTPNPMMGRRLTWSSADGSFLHEIQRKGEWFPVRRREAARVPAPGAARAEVVEILLPLGPKGLGLEAGPDLHLAVLTRGPEGTTKSPRTPAKP